jgi:predicted ester cyclase
LPTPRLGELKNLLDIAKPTCHQAEIQTVKLTWNSCWTRHAEARKLRKDEENQRERNRALMRAYFHAYDSGDRNAVWLFLDPKHTYYPPGGSEPMDLAGRMHDEMFFFRAFSNIRTTVEDQIAEGDKVASRVTMSADHTGEYQSIPPTGTRTKFVFIDISRICKGRIVEEWAEFDMGSILQQLRAHY